MLDAYYMDDSEEDQRLPHRQVPDAPVTTEQLAKIGFLYWHMPGACEKWGAVGQHSNWSPVKRRLLFQNEESDPDADDGLTKLRSDRGYRFVDFISVCREKLPNYEEMIRVFYREHLHQDEEIRFILEGSGYFDIRDADDKWIRVLVKKGDLIILPAGIFHRFTVDTHNTIRAMRLFTQIPVWTAYNRDEPATEEMPCRVAYVEAVKSGAFSHSAPAAAAQRRSIDMAIGASVSSHETHSGGSGGAEHDGGSSSGNHTASGSAGAGAAAVPAADPLHMEGPCGTSLHPRGPLAAVHGAGSKAFPGPSPFAGRPVHPHRPSSLRGEVTIAPSPAVVTAAAPSSGSAASAAAGASGTGSG